MKRLTQRSYQLLLLKICRRLIKHQSQQETLNLYSILPSQDSLNNLLWENVKLLKFNLVILHKSLPVKIPFRLLQENLFDYLKNRALLNSPKRWIEIVLYWVLSPSFQNPCHWRPGSMKVQQRLKNEILLFIRPVAFLNDRIENINPSFPTLLSASSV